MYNSIFENLIILLPLLALHLSLMIFCIVKITKEGVANLNKAVWILLVICINLFGSVLFLIIGRKRDEYDSCE